MKITDLVDLLNVSRMENLFEKFLAVFSRGGQKVGGDLLDLMQGLETVDWLSQVALLQQVHKVFSVQFYVLGPAYFLELIQLNLSRNGLESEFDTSWSHWLNDSVL